MLMEFRSINLSLLHLNQVINILANESPGIKAHMPYQNSALTTILKGSLGGDCATTMIANIVLNRKCIEVSL